MMKKDEKCPNCESTKIIMNAKILDRADSQRHDELCVVVEGNANAFIFKDKSYGVMTACICSDCGFTEIYTANARELYEKNKAFIVDL
jgi:predicted nucleic-acid-binding Zn-ribbon protein